MFERVDQPRPLLALAVVVALTAGCAGLPEPASWARVAEDDQPDLPPIARLLLPGAPAVAGRLGSFAYRDSYADTPWLAHGLEPVSVRGRQQLTLALPPGHGFTRWSARIAAAADEAGNVVMPLAGGAGARLAHAAFDPPAEGAWVLQVMLTFADGDGDAAYYWLVEVT